MAMFTEARAMIFGTREHKNKNGKTVLFANFSVLSGRKTGEDENGDPIYENDKPFNKSAVVVGKDAQKFLRNCEERSFAKILLKQYTYSVGEGKEQEWKEAIEILTAELPDEEAA
jgi:hypothetical protein